MEHAVACSFRVDEGSLLTAIESAAVAAEESGLASWWSVGDREQAIDGSHDAVLGLQCVARVTDRIRLGLSGELLEAHNLGVRAKQLASLDWFSGGRLELGLDLGELPAALRGPFIASDGQDTAGSAELQAAMRALWTSRRAEFTGEHIAFAGAIALPKPVGDRALRTHIRHGVPLGRAVSEIGDVSGWLGWDISADAIGAALDELDSALEGLDEPAEVRRTWFVAHGDTAEAVAAAETSGGRIDEIVTVFDRVPSPDELRELVH